MCHLRAILKTTTALTDKQTIRCIATLQMTHYEGAKYFRSEACENNKQFSLI